MFDVNNASETPAQFDPYSVFNVERPKMPHSALTFTVESLQVDFYFICHFLFKIRFLLWLFQTFFSFYLQP